jgi:hypothetical protein
LNQSSWILVRTSPIPRQQHELSIARSGSSVEKESGLTLIRCLVVKLIHLDLIWIPYLRLIIFSLSVDSVFRIISRLNRLSLSDVFLKIGYIYISICIYTVFLKNCSAARGELTGEWGCTALPQLSCRVRERGLPSCGLGPLFTTVSCFVTIRASAAVVPTFLVCNGPIVIDSRGPFHTGHKY